MEASGQMTPEQVEEQIEEGIVKSWKWLILLGNLSLIAGFVAILVPAVSSVAIAIFIGWIFVLFGILQMAAAFGVKSGTQVAGRFLLGLITTVAGIYLLAAPLKGTVTLTFVLAVFYLSSGVVSVVVAISQRGTHNAGLLALNGILALIIGGLVIGDFPSSSDWALGLLAGVYLIFEGVTLIGTGATGRKLAKS